jgi:hypothetical protein
MTENAGEVVVATLHSSSDAAQVRTFFDSLKTLRKVGKGFAFRHTYVQPSVSSFSFNPTAAGGDVMQLMALKEEPK